MSRAVYDVIRVQGYSDKNLKSYHWSASPSPRGNYTLYLSFFYSNLYFLGLI